jgi:hypothetical protein
MYVLIVTNVTLTLMYVLIVTNITLTLMYTQMYCDQCYININVRTWLNRLHLQTNNIYFLISYHLDSPWHAVFYTICQGFSSADDRSFTPVMVARTLLAIATFRY